MDDNDLLKKLSNALDELEKESKIVLKTINYIINITSLAFIIQTVMVVIKNA